MDHAEEQGQGLRSCVPGHRPLFIGTGPSGLVTALWAARQGLTVYLLDKKEGPLDRGHADGLEPLTLEILDSLGIGDEIWKKANKTVEICTWAGYRPWNVSAMS